MQKSILQYVKRIFQSKVIPLFLPKYSKLGNSEIKVYYKYGILYTFYGILYTLYAEWPLVLEKSPEKVEN